MNPFAVTYDTPECRCPACGRKLEAVTSVGHGHKPKPGDLSVCLYCDCLLQFSGDLTIRALSAEEVSALPPEEERALNSGCIVNDY